MLDTIVLLAGPVEVPVLASVLRSHNPQLAVLAAKTLADLEAIEPQVLQRARLIAFVTPVVVPARILDGLGFGAYNFHPGPPHYPGWVPSHFATYDRATDFGATAHVMVESVDAGPIVGVELFAVPPGTGVLGLEALAFAKLARLFWRLARPLATQYEPLPELPIQWRGRKSTRRQYAAMCDIPLNISRDELDRRIDVFGAGHFGIVPTVTLHGHRFRYIAPEPEAKIESPSLVPAEPKVTEPA
jgi:methionyl-tRNA formyltransferase